MLYSDYLNNRKAYQERGYLFLLERKHACLYYKPGKGKTYPCIDAIRDIDASKNGNAKVLILSTADAIKNMWNVEIVPQNILPIHTTLMTFNSAVVDKRKVELLSVKWDIIVIDECHKIKSHNTKISKLVFLLTKRCEYAFGLSGTPRGNSDIDIFCQFHNMHISDWGDISYTYFVEHCCDIDQKYFNGHTIKVPTGINEKYKSGWERNVAMYTQRVDYDEEDDMPPLNVQVINVPYNVTKEYTQAEQGVISIPDYETTLTKLAAINKLHQIANGYMYIPDEKIPNKHTIWQITDAFSNNKLKYILYTDEPTVIVYKFKQDLDDIRNYLGTNYTEIIDDFKSGKATYLLLQCSRCESFNLQMCSNIVFYTMDYSYICYDQMIHRLWRMGQNKPVNVTILVNEHTVENKIWKTVESKGNLSDLFFSIKDM